MTERIAYNEYAKLKYCIGVATRAHSANLILKSHCRLDLRRNFFSEQVVNQQVIDWGTLNAFKTDLDHTRRTLIAFFTHLLHGLTARLASALTSLDTSYRCGCTWYVPTCICPFDLNFAL